MSLHSYSRCWLHLIWGTRDRENLLHKQAAARVARHLSEYAKSKQIYMKTNFVNADHVHALIDLPTNMSIEEIVQLFKGSSSHWINANDVIKSKFAWGRGYGAFSVSESNVSAVAEYIAGQEEHHRMRTFADELKGVQQTAWTEVAVGTKPLKRLLSLTLLVHRPEGRC